MNPLIVAGQGAVALAVLIALRIAGDPLAAAIVGGTLLLIGIVLQAAFRPKPPPSKWVWLSRLLATLPVATFVSLGVVPYILYRASLSAKHKAVQHVHHIHHPHHVADVLLALACGAACIYTSSLIDTYYVMPRMRGDRGKRPCQTSKDAGWRALTQVWLLHRILVFLAVRVSLAAGVLIAVVASIPKPTTAETSVIVALSSLVAGYLLNRVTPIFISAINPPFYVGDKVWLVEEYAAGSKPQTCYYAVDVSINGVGLLELADSNRVLDRERQPDPISRTGRSHDRVVEIGDMGRLLRARRTFTECSATDCWLVNKYCRRVEELRNPSSAQAAPSTAEQQPGSPATQTQTGTPHA